MTTDTRPPLTRERIVDAAVRFADEHGLDGLSMRKLGAELRVEAMSLYNHVEDKGDILDGMIDHVFGAIALPDSGKDWRESLRHIGSAALAAFRGHPWVVTLLMERGTPGPGALAFWDRVLGIIRSAGFSDEDTHHVWQMLASHTMGYAFQANQPPAHGGSEVDRANLQTEIGRVADRFPNVARMAPYLANCDFDYEYDFGLDIILDGLSARLG